jgi:MFS family permease
MPFRPASLLLMLTAVFVLVTANGIMSTLIPFRAKLEHFPDLVIGLIGSSFYGGFLIGALIAPALIRRVGHIGGFVVCSLCGGLAALALPFVIEPFVWIGLRLAVGFSLTGLYTIVESWLSGASDNATRGRVLGICSVVQYAAWAAGSLIFTFADPATFVLFGLGAALFALAAVPFILIRETPPARPARLSLDLVKFFRTAPSAAVAALLIGFANGPLYALTPAFGAEIGFTPAEVGMMMTVFTLGSAAFQVPNGWLSDHIERQRLLIALAAVAAVLEFLLGGFGTILPILAIFATAFIIGAVDAAQYYVAAAHAVDRCGRDNAMSAMSAMVVLYGIGAVTGPPIASLVMTYTGASSIYIAQSLTHVALIAFIARQLLVTRSRASATV